MLHPVCALDFGDEWSLDFAARRVQLKMMSLLWAKHREIKPLIVQSKNNSKKGSEKKKLRHFKKKERGIKKRKEKGDEEKEMC